MALSKMDISELTETIAEQLVDAIRESVVAEKTRLSRDFWIPPECSLYPDAPTLHWARDVVFANRKLIDEFCTNAEEEDMKYLVEFFESEASLPAIRRAFYKFVMDHVIDHEHATKTPLASKAFASWYAIRYNIPPTTFYCFRVSLA